MKSVTNIKSLLIAATLALGFTAAAAAQSATTAPVSTATATNATNPEPTYGLLGSRYVGLDYSYLRFDQPRSPRSGHEFGADYNQPLHPGLDFTASFTDTSTGYLGTRPRTDELLAGLTAYQPVNRWIKPFVAGQAGVAFLRDTELFSTSGIVTSRNSSDRFDYILSTGAEFQVLPALAVTPFVSYQEIHQFSHDWNYGVKGTYRFTPSWSASLAPSIDEHHRLGYQAGVNFHF